jgi:hypothetical protein
MRDDDCGVEDCGVDGERLPGTPGTDLDRPTVERHASCACGSEQFVVESPDWHLSCRECGTPFAEIRWKTDLSGLIYTIRP